MFDLKEKLKKSDPLFKKDSQINVFLYKIIIYFQKDRITPEKDYYCVFFVTSFQKIFSAS